MKKIFQKKQKGFTLLFAILVSTLVISIGASMISIALRQTVLSGTSRESQYAFYAADTAMECAYYWDTVGSNELENPIFPVSGNLDSTNVNNSEIKCSGYEFLNSGEITTDSGVTNFKLQIKDIGTSQKSLKTYCAEVTVIKEPESTGLTKTRIESKGYNTCDTNNIKRVERGLIQEYRS